MRKKRKNKPNRKRSTRRRGPGKSRARIALVARVEKRAMLGESEAEAAKNEGISKSAVHRILSREEFRSIQAEGRSDVLRLVHKAARVE